MRSLLIGLLWTLATFGALFIVSLLYNRGDLPPTTNVDWVTTAAFWFMAWLTMSMFIAWRKR